MTSTPVPPGTPWPGRPSRYDVILDGQKHQVSDGRDLELVRKSVQQAAKMRGLRVITHVDREANCLWVQVIK